MKAGVFAALGLKIVNSGLYDGVWADTAGRKTIAVHSPINGAKLADVAVAGESDYERLIGNAWDAYSAWSHVPRPNGVR